MQKNYCLPILILFASLSGCGTMQNASLAEAHDRYNNARSNPDVTNLAAVELKQAGDTLAKADSALSHSASTATVDHLAYLAKQQVEIAQQTAKRKAAEEMVTQANVQRDQLRLEARTAEADAARQQAALAQGTVDQQAAEITAANAKAESDNAKAESELAAANAKAENAQQKAESAQQLAEQKSAELQAASAEAENNRALLAQQEAQLKELNAKQTDRGVVITLGDVLFDRGRAQLKPASMRNIQKLVDFLKQNPQRKILIEGYTDSTGSDSFNQQLSEQRANAVRTVLTDHGIADDRIMTRGYGKAFPVADNDTAANRQMNRRVEIILSDDKGNIAAPR